MKPHIQILRLLVLSLVCASVPAWAAGKPQSVYGSGALAFAALVGENAPLPAEEKTRLADFLSARSPRQPPTGRKIIVTADQITCRASTVDLTAHSCHLVFGKTQVDLAGRNAHELFATMAEIGVPSEGAAGTIYEGLRNLACTVDPAEIESKDGGGATCEFAPAAG